MSTVRIQTDQIEPVEALILDGSLVPLSGLTDVLISIRRQSDDFWLDFSDVTFKSTGWTTRQLAMSEVDAVNDPGVYRYSFDTSAVTNAVIDDAYEVRVDQSPGTDAANVPQIGEIKSGQYVDELDATVSSRATQLQIVSDGVPFLGANIDAAVGSRSSHTAADVRVEMDANSIDLDNIQAMIASLQDLSVADVQSAMTNQGYTTARALLIDNLDAAISAVLSAISGLNDLSQADVQSAMTAQGYTVARATLLDNLDAAISSISSISIADVQTAMTNQGYTTARAAFLDNLDATISSVAAQIAALNDVSIADVQTAMTNQGYTAARAILLDNLVSILTAVEKIRKVTSNKVIINATDTLIDVYEDNGTTIAFSFTVSGDRRTRIPL